MQAIVNSSMDALVILNADGVIQFVNPATVALFGRAAEVLVGSAFGFPVVAGEFSEIDLVAADGQVRAVEMRVSNITWNDEPNLLAELHDVTDQRRIQQELQEAKAFNEAVLNALTSHIAVVNRDGLILVVNRAWTVFAAENGDPDLIHSGVGANYFAICRKAAAKGEVLAKEALHGILSVLNGQEDVFELEYPCHSPNEERWFMLRVTPFPGAVGGLVISHTDITHRRQMTRQQFEEEVRVERLERHERELVSLENRLQRGANAALDEAAGVLTLHEKMPDRFAELVKRCEGLLDKAVEQRMYRVDNGVSNEVRGVAEYLGLLKAGPRDVMEIYLTALKNRINQHPVSKSNIYIEEGRILALELMGYLVGFYRNYLPPVIRNPASS